MNHQCQPSDFFFTDFNLIFLMQINHRLHRHLFGHEGALHLNLTGKLRSPQMIAGTSEQTVEMQRDIIDQLNVFVDGAEQIGLGQMLN